MKEIKKGEGKTVFIPFLLLVFILPFVFALNPGSSIDLSAVRVAIPLLFLLWLAVFLFKKNLLIDVRWRFWALLALILLSFVSVLWAEEEAWAIRKSLFLASVFPIYFVAFSFFKKRGGFFQFSKVLSWSAFLTAFLGVVQFFSQFFIGLETILRLQRKVAPFFLGNNFAEEVIQYNSWMVNLGGHTLLRSFAVFPDPHLFAIFLTLSLPFTIYAYLKSEKRIYLIISTFILAGLFLSFSRAAYLGVLAIFFASVFAIKPFKRNVLVVLVSLLMLFSLVAVFHQRFFSIFDLKEGSVSSRVEMLEKSWQVFAQNPVKGVGIGNLPKAVEYSSSYRQPIYAHNLFLDFASELGLIGLSLLSIAVGAPLAYLFKGATLEQKITAISVLALLVLAMFETPFYSVRVFPLILIILAI
ncbi:MAG: O-antigen ligase family protein [Candidatus Moranbacteria bacterium]|nr:O-antigen ligase family protein [Candidatus Moranbacteria bacterium]